MLSIRMQRTGRSGDAHFRMVVQDSRQTPTSGRVIANLGFYNPHTKETKINTEKAEFYLKNGAQPTERIAHLFRQNGINIPSWVAATTKKSANIKHADKLRKNQPKVIPDAQVEIAEEVANEQAKQEVVAEASEEATLESRAEA